MPRRNTRKSPARTAKRKLYRAILNREPLTARQRKASGLPAPWDVYYIEYMHDVGYIKGRVGRLPYEWWARERERRGGKIIAVSELYTTRAKRNQTWERKSRITGVPIVNADKDHEVE